MSTLLKLIGIFSILHCLGSVHSAFSKLVCPISEHTISKDTLSFLFDTLPNQEKKQFIETHQMEIPEIILSYYDKYDAIENIDSVFDVLAAFDFSKTMSTPRLSFLIYAFNQTLKSPSDGYVGEMRIDVCYSLFSHYPGCFYQYLSYASVDEQETLMNEIAMYLVLNNISEKDWEYILQRHKSIFPQFEPIIVDLKKYVQENKENI